MFATAKAAAQVVVDELGPIEEPQTTPGETPQPDPSSK
jgi:hypothetical protein